jgi:DNA-binding MarR family transcriptional regulator
MIPLLDRLLLIADLFQRDMARAFEGTDLSTARMAVLWTVHHQGPSTQQSLATALSVTPRNISGLVDALEASGHVARTAHATDRRAHLIALTEQGRSVMERTSVEHEELTATLLGAVAPEDREPLERGLAAITDTLEALLAEASARTDKPR